MRISEKVKNKKWQKRILELTSLAVLLTAGNLALRMLLVEHTYADDYKADLVQIAENGENPDLVFLGSSRSFHSFVPYVFEEAAGIGSAAPSGTDGAKCIALNAGSALQTPEGSYYALKDLLDRGFSPRCVVLGVSYNLLTTQVWTQADLIIMDRLTPQNRAEYLEYAYEAENKLYAESMLYRYRTNFTLERIRANLTEQKDRQLAASSGMPYVKDGEWYDGKGYVVNKNRLPEQIASGAVSEPEIDEFTLEAVREERLYYLDKLVGLCVKNGISLALVDTPTTAYMLDHVKSYEEANKWWEDYAAQYGIVYLNYNYIENKDELFPDELFMDYNHLNHEGAVKFSQLCAKDLKEKKLWVY